MPFARTIGIIGGMGPFAGSALFAGVLHAARQGHGARANHEFPRVLVASPPVRSLVAGEDANDAVIARVSAEGAWLRSAGAEVLALACVTMHAHLERIVAGSGGGEWVSLVSLAADEVVARGSRRPLLLSSPTTARRGVFAAPLAARGVEPICLSATEEECLVEVIHALVAGADARHHLAAVEAITRAGARRGADSVVLACTELAAFAASALPLPAIDPLGTAARALCQAAARVEGGRA